MTVGDRLAQIEIGRKKGIRESIDALKAELRIVRTAIVATVDEQEKPRLVDRQETWVMAIELLEALAL